MHQKYNYLIALACQLLGNKCIVPITAGAKHFVSLFSY
jgi:hypothetical protein